MADRHGSQLPNLARDPARDFPERRTPRRECERGSSAREIPPWLGKGSAARSPRHPKRRNKPNLAELQWNQAPTADKPATELRAVSKLLVGGSANRSLTVAAPAGGSRLFGSRAREQAVSSKILFGFLKEEVFHRPVSERSRGEAARQERIRGRPNTIVARAGGENRTEPCPSGRGPFRWLFFGRGGRPRIKKITKQTQSAYKSMHVNHLGLHP